MTDTAHKPEPCPGPLTEQRRATLDAVLDLIIPPRDTRGLPGASQVGIAAHLAQHASDALPELCAQLDELERLAHDRDGAPFVTLGLARQQGLVDSIRAVRPAFMERLAFETMGCYYRDDRVLTALGMEARPPAPKGYTVLPGDLALLEPVRRRKKMYRSA